MQIEAVSGKLVPAEYEIYFCDNKLNFVSNIQTMLANKTGKPQERAIKLRFTLKNIHFDENAVYYLKIADKETSAIIEQMEFSVRVAFVNHSDF